MYAVCVSIQPRAASTKKMIGASAATPWTQMPAKMSRRSLPLSGRWSSIISCRNSAYASATATTNAAPMIETIAVPGEACSWSSTSTSASTTIEP